MAKSHQLQIRVSAGQKAALRRQARRAGLDMSTYVLARALPARLRTYLLRSSPVAFKRRNLFVDATVGDRV